MSDNSAIEWTDATWNPTTGCDRVSPGCAKCYAKTLHDKRYEAFLDGWTTAPAQYHQPFEVVQVHESRLDAPLRWRAPRKVFVNSVSDLFYGDEADRQRCEREGRPFNPVPDAFIDRVFAVMALAPQHTFQVLTKRADRMREYLTGTADGWGRAARIAAAAQALLGFDGAKYRPMKPPALPSADVFWMGSCNPPDQPYRERWILKTWPLLNVWLGVSVENQHFADERIPLLLQTPAAVRFLSCEPLLEGLDLAKHRPGALGLHWCIVGGESGPGARPCETWWIRNIVGQCRDADVAVFVKQLGAKPIETVDHVQRWDLNLRDRKGGDPSEWPDGLNVREFPTVRS